MSRNKIAIIVEGGVVQCVFESGPCVIDEVIIIDHDNMEAAGHTRSEADAIAACFTDDMVEREMVDILDLESEVA